jgi:hypothetical protein
MLNRHVTARTWRQMLAMCTHLRAVKASTVEGNTGLTSCVAQFSYFQANISWKLALVLKSLASPTLLSTYNDERLPVIAQMLQATSHLHTHIVMRPKVKQKESPEEDDNKSGWLRWRNTALAMYGINYRFSDIVLEERDPDPDSAGREEAIARAYTWYEGLGSLLAGDRAPEAPGLVTVGGNETSLFKDYFKLDRHTVMVFAPDAKGADSVLEQEGRWPESAVQTLVILDYNLDQGKIDCSGATLLWDRDSHAANAYRVEKGLLTIIVVRPDGFVGAVLKDAEGLARYFGKIFRNI